MISLSKNALGEAGGVAVAEALAKGVMPQLQLIDLSENALGEAGGVALAEALGKGVTPQLREV